MSSCYSEILRVNLAGEWGARHIYAGQLWVMRQRGSPFVQEIEAMDGQEAHHVEVFERLARQYKVRPTLLSPVWAAAGWSMGAVTALLGDEEAMACTAAVETVIDAHYSEQIAGLDAGADAPLIETLQACQEDERAHRDTAMHHGAGNASSLLHGIIAAATRFAISASKRL